MNSSSVTGTGKSFKVRSFYDGMCLGSDSILWHTIETTDKGLQDIQFKGKPSLVRVFEKCSHK